MSEDIRFLKRAQVLSRTGLGKSNLFEKIRKGEFPPPVKVGASSRWVESEVTEWQKAIIAERDHGSTR